MSTADTIPLINLETGLPFGGSAGASPIGCGGEGEPNRAKEGGDGEVPEKSLEVRHFQVLTYPKERELAELDESAPSWATGGGWL